MKSKFYIRTDGSSKIGLGHVIRCVALAHMIKGIVNPTFVCKEIPEETASDISCEGFNIVKIKNEDEFLSLVNKSDLVILDGYQFDTAYQQEVKNRSATLVVIDDLHEQCFLADLIINHAPGVSETDYKATPHTHFALGPQYALLRPGFLNTHIKKNDNRDTKSVLICFGGLDYKNLSLTVLTEVTNIPVFERIVLVTGVSFAYLDIIAPIIKNDERIVHYHAISERGMIDAMNNADLAIIPASGILLEALAIGPSIISGMYADNQKLLYERYKSVGAFIDAGSFSKEEIRKAIGQFLNVRTKNNAFFDGQSSKRILEKIYTITLTLRKADATDCLILYNWANERDVRINAINKEYIELSNHKRWFEAKLKSSETCFFILEFMGEPVGQIRYDKVDDYWTIDYSIDKAYRGKGLGRYIIKNTLHYFKKTTIKAYVLPDNLGSGSVFKALKFLASENEMIKNTMCNVYKLSV